MVLIAQTAVQGLVCMLANIGRGLGDSEHSVNCVARSHNHKGLTYRH